MCDEIQGCESSESYQYPLDQISETMWCSKNSPSPNMTPDKILSSNKQFSFEQPCKRNDKMELNASNAEPFWASTPNNYKDEFDINESGGNVL